MTKMPHVNEEGRKELLKADDQFNEVQKDLKETVIAATERRISLPQCQPEDDIRRSTKELKVAEAQVIRPLKSIADKARFNETYRKEWERSWEYVKAVIENHEIIGEDVECWTHKFAGDPAHFWRIPTNKPVMIPRLLAEQLSNCKYHRIVMEEKVHSQGDGLSFFGAAQAVEVRNRISARIIPDSSNIAMGF